MLPSTLLILGQTLGRSDFMVVVYRPPTFRDIIENLKYKQKTDGFFSQESLLFPHDNEICRPHIMLNVLPLICFLKHFWVC